ncbi:MAG: NAD(P)-dependent oxidoreductase [Candidatus Daviesbacteria bacterium]|nr:NAD(P)-dependent oxidoreductase [Candidatus Daviesbacteria bacterium]
MTSKILLITGATGFIGRNLVACLSERGDLYLRLLVRDVDKAKSLFGAKHNIQIIKGDLSNITSLISATNGVDEIIHLAGEVSSWGDKDIFISTNIEGTKSLLLAASKSDKPIKRIICTSSIAVYGCSDDNPVKESSILPKLSWPYANSKVEMEKIIERNNFISYVILRLGDVIGKDSVWVTNPIKLMRYRFLFLIRESKGQINFISIKDVIESIKTILNSDIVNTTYNVTAGTSVSFNEYFRDLALKNKLPIPISLPKQVVYFFTGLIEFVYRLLSLKNEATLHSLNYISCERHINIDKILKETNWTPKITYTSMIEQT